MASDDIVTMSAASWLLGSLWTLTLAALAAPVSVVRTALADRILQCDLDGYAGCACLQCLVPCIWQAGPHGSCRRRNAVNTDRIIQEPRRNN